MKTFQIAVTTLLLGTFNFAVANDDVDAQIAQINNASAQERVQLMNEFKLKLSTLSAQEREEAITKLQTKTQNQEQVRERIRQNQTEQTENMKRSQQMNQLQNASPMMQQNNMGSGGSQMQMGKK
ncbi:MAG: hypothetical protein PHH41_10205 [Sulfurimonas sp.]|nr:hypothetical protein [Sulfurimonas sp.]MDD3061031.1 hypothetical protein [Sulfurimonas sp.]MDD5203503.1 hypothetical protein [Sulfurimonas sp.]